MIGAGDRVLLVDMAVLLGDDEPEPFPPSFCTSPPLQSTVCAPWVQFLYKMFTSLQSISSIRDLCRLGLGKRWRRGGARTVMAAVREGGHAGETLSGAAALGCQYAATVTRCEAGRTTGAEAEEIGIKEREIQLGCNGPWPGEE